LDGRLPGGLAAQGFDFQIGHPAVRALARAACHGITHQRHAGDRRASVEVQGHHAVTLARHGRGQVLELAWKVLVDEKDVHGDLRKLESLHGKTRPK
jgi:hypothetical protein